MLLRSYREASPLPQLLAVADHVTAPEHVTTAEHSTAANPVATAKHVATAEYAGTAEYAATAETGRATSLPPLPPALIVHAADDPWVPVSSTERLAASALAAEQGGPWQVLITQKGGHNGFHAACDAPGGQDGNWGDRLTARWLRRLAGGLAGR